MYAKAIQGPDAARFVATMEAVIAILILINVFKIIQRTADMDVLSGVWALKMKQYPNGWVNKLKAWYCTCGSEQLKGINDFETFSPVIMLLTVWLLLVISILLDIETSWIDYTSMFNHDPIDCLVYVEMPKGFSIDGYVWKLNKCIHGLKQSPHNFILYNKEKLKKMDFNQAAADPCLFISADVICLLYIDDNLYYYKGKKAMEKLKKSIEVESIMFREEESVAGNVGVHIPIP